MKIGERKINLIARLIPTLVLAGVVITLAFTWSEPETRGGAFAFFLILMLYSVVMICFSDVICLMGKKPLYVRYPYFVVSSIHAGYVILLLLLRFISVRVGDVYFVLGAIIGTGAHITLLLWMYRGFLNIGAQNQERDQLRNIKVQRELQMADLASNFKNSPELSQNRELMGRLDILSRTWILSPERETVATAPITTEINEHIQELIIAVADNVTVASATDQIKTIMDLVERRSITLQRK